MSSTQPQSPAPALQLSDDEYAAEKARKKYRHGRRRARERAGEIKELNITAMMDMMTILLVFLIKSYTASAENITISDNLAIPRSTTQKGPQDNINIMITTTEVAVNDKKTVPVQNGLIDAEYRETEGGMLIMPVFDALKKEVDKQKYIAKYNPNAPFQGRINVIADKRVPYQTILAILYTAGQAELAEYKLMALKND